MGGCCDGWYLGVGILLEMNGVVWWEEEGMCEVIMFGVWYGVVWGVLERLVVGIGVGLRVGCDEYVDERV